MLTIITGGAMSHKDELLRNRITESVKQGKKVIVLIPDQFSFEYDKLLYDIFGAKTFNRITVIGMNRLAAEIRKQQGSDKGTAADDNTKTILMFLAIKKAKREDNLRYYLKNADKPSFAAEMLETVAEFRRNEVDPATLEKASQELGGTVAEKLHDMAVIFDNYNLLLAERGLCDGLSEVSETADMAQKHGLFNGCHIYIDRYDTFSADEFRLIEVMLHQCGELAVALTISDENNSRSNLSPFAAVCRTRSELERMAAAAGIPVNTESSAQYYYNKSALTHVNANIFCIENHPSPNSEGVKAVFAQDCYDEVEYCAAEIKRIVREEKVKYSDIAVITRQLEDYAPVLESAFERYEIPAFIDMGKSVSGSALAIYLSAVLDCLKGRSFRTEKILRMIKSPISPFKDFEVSAIEEYCYCWNVEGDMWASPFTACNPRNNNLTTVNKIRERIVAPVTDFRSKEHETAAELVKDLVSVFESYELTSCVNSVAARSKLSGNDIKNYISEQSDRLELAREFGQMWRKFLAGLRSVYEVIGELKLSFREFSDLFSLLLSGMTVSEPPQRLNTVTVASAEHSRLSAVKAVFVLGANADKLPASPRQGGLFSEKEKKLLSENGVPFNDTAISSIYRERLTAYLAVTQGSDKLYVCCPKADFKGGGLEPSTLVRQLVNMFGSSVTVDASSLGAGFYCCTPNSAFTGFAERMNDNTVESVTLKKALESVPEYKEKVKRLLDNSQKKEFSLSEDIAGKLFFEQSGDTRTIKVSASSVEKYNSCPFRYFCNYGLALTTPARNSINGANRGNIIHYILENIMATEKDGRKYYDPAFETMSDEEIRRRVDRYAKEYLEDQMGGDFGKTARFFAALERISENAVFVVKNIRTELSQSEFKPCDFELSLSEENGKPFLSLKNHEMTIIIKGKIDRVDVFTDETGKKFYKIVDYKTGKVSNLKNFMKKILHGANLQMMIYLAALLERENRISPESSEAAGVIYTPAVYITSSSAAAAQTTALEDVSVSAVVSQQYADKKLERYGIVCDDKKILDALNKDNSELFIPARNGAVVEKEIMQAIETHAVSMLEKVGNDLQKGKIPADPLADATERKIKKPCAYCDFWTICGAKQMLPKKFITKDDDKRFRELLEGLVSAKAGKKE